MLLEIILNDPIEILILFLTWKIMDLSLVSNQVMWY